MASASSPRFLVVSALALFLRLAAHGAENSKPALLPLGTFFDSNSIRQAVLSPDGTKIAMVAPNHGRYGIAVLDTTTGKLSVPVVFHDENIRSLFWKGNGRILFYSAVEGHEIPLLASTDLAGKSVVRILEPRVRRDDLSIFFGRLVDSFPSDPESILILGFTAESDARRVRPVSGATFDPVVYRVNVATGRRTQVVVLPRDFEPGLIDKAGNQRLTRELDGRQIHYRIRAHNRDSWRTIRTFEATNVGWDIQQLLADGRTVLLMDYTKEDRGVLRALNLDTGELGEALFQPPAGEIDSLILAPHRDRLLGVVYEDDRPRNHWIDPRWRGVMTTIERQYPDHVISVTSISDDETRFIFRVHSDRDPGQYVLADLRGEGVRVQPINAVRPAIKPTQMSPMQPIEFPARDGLIIHGYLTKPGGKVDSHTALLLMPHGGPFGIRDSWTFHADVQFLASRGYAVLQVNYRGSGGYGRAFERAGYGEWGGRMQDDLTDAVKWVLAQGWADPQRVGIIGASYGGYAALAGVTMTPELYRVGINYVGVSDLRLITRYDLGKSAATKEVYAQRIGSDPAQLAARSPVELVSRIRVPTLHAYGRNDPRVEFSHWEVLEKALRKHGKPYEIVIEDAEGHGFEKEETSSKFYSAVEAFLTRNMPSDALGSRTDAAPAASR